MIIEKDKVKRLEEKTKHMDSGIASLILGIMGIASLFLLGWLIGLPLGLLAFILGHKAKKCGEKYGTYGMILGAIIMILFLTMMMFAVFVLWFWQ